MMLATGLSLTSVVCGAGTRTGRHLDRSGGMTLLNDSHTSISRQLEHRREEDNTANGDVAAISDSTLHGSWCVFFLLCSVLRVAS